MWRTGEGLGEGNGDWEVEWEEETTMGVGLADRECTERAWGEGASRLMTAGLMQPLELLASEVWLGPGVMVTGVSEPGLTSSSSSELSSVRSITSFFLPPGNSRAQSHTPASQVPAPPHLPARMAHPRHRGVCSSRKIHRDMTQGLIKMNRIQDRFSCSGAAWR